MIRSLPYTILILILINYKYLLPADALKVVTNKMRYATSENNKTPNNLQFNHMLELAASSSPGAKYLYPKHQIVLNNNKKFRNAGVKSLDEEDKRLLEKFYRDAKDGDPFLTDSMSTASLWDDPETRGLNALADGALQLNQTDVDEGWTFDPDAILSSTSEAAIDANQAGYSPTLRLLTSYDPVSEETDSALLDKSNKWRGNRIVGTTLYGKSINSKPSIKSKSALEAIKLHDSLLRSPPRDGIVRVRMYYHRAIHDDVSLYGNGPWKYWGHGWGLEFGFDPKSKKSAEDFYQKGYTIERAYGRDFCLDNKNCRKSDPEFFNDPLRVGHYSRKQAKLLAQQQRKGEKLIRY